MFLFIQLEIFPPCNSLLGCSGGLSAEAGKYHPELCIYYEAYFGHDLCKFRVGVERQDFGVLKHGKGCM